MPNLHFCGMDRALALHKIEKIKRILKDDPVLEEMAFTIHAYVEVLDIHGINQPFIGITSSPGIDAEELAGKLDELDIDFETSKLTKYIPARSKRKNNSE